MSKYKELNGVKVMEGTKTFELLESKNPEDHKKAARLAAFCNKAEKCKYEYSKLMVLREEYKDVL